MIGWLAYAQSDELIVQDDPGEQVDEGDVGGEQRHDVGGVQDGQRVHVHPIGAHPQEAEQQTPAGERSCRERVIVEDLFGGSCNVI